MKYLSISLTLILTLLANQSALAEVKETSLNPSTGIETIVVIAQPEVADFEIFSLNRSKQVMQEIMDTVAADLGNDEAPTFQSASEAIASI
jgi:hypothetical protein